jgi:Domain of unknown function (DUF5666)
MSAVPYDSHEQDWDRTEQQPSMSPGRPRRRFFNRRSAALAAVITCAAGFYAGIRVEKGQLASTASAATTSATGGAAGARTGAAAGGSAATGSGAAGGFPGAARFGGGAGGNASLGTISSVNGSTIYLTDTTGNTVKVALSPSTKLTKSLSVSKGALHPGDSVVIQGVKNSSGTVVATSVSDSGARTTGSSSTGGGSSSGG